MKFSYIIAGTVLMCIGFVMLAINIGLVNSYLTAGGVAVSVTGAGIVIFGAYKE